MTLPKINTYKKGEFIHHPCIYYLIKDKVIIYIGLTFDLKQRLYSHKEKNYDIVKYRIIINALNIRTFERNEILKHKPILNKVKMKGYSIVKAIKIPAKKKMNMAKATLQIENSMSKLFPKRKGRKPLADRGDVKVEIKIYPKQKEVDKLENIQEIAAEAITLEYNRVMNL